MHVVGTRSNMVRVNCMDTVVYGAECLSAYYILIYVITRTHSMYVGTCICVVYIMKYRCIPTDDILIICTTYTRNVRLRSFDSVIKVVS